MNANCHWTGTRDQLYCHLTKSSCGSIQAKLQKFNLLNEQLNEQIRIQKKCIDQQEIEIQQQLIKHKMQIDNDEQEIGLMKNQLDQKNIESNKHNSTITSLNERLAQKSDVINAKITENQQLNAELTKCRTDITLIKNQLRETEKCMYYQTRG